MTQEQKEVQAANLNEEKKVIRQLQQVYNRAAKDCEEKIAALNARTDLQNLQSIIYQKQYQEALKSQIDGILTTLQTNNFDTISEYLVKSYENGYVGAMYDLHSQGIPVITPLNQKQVVKAVQTDSKISTTLYKKLGEDVTYLKKSIKAELSRGVATGSSWLEIAQKIANGMNSPYKKALTRAILIARTEGHRVQQESQLDALATAKDNGADIVKQWDSTLDSRTRPDHRAADGQIVELDEYFTVGGEKMKAPGVGGSAKQVCNCRCCMLQRAKWALDEDELQTLKDKAAYFGLDKTKDFEDFKQKYLKASTQASVTFGHPNCDLAKKYGDSYYEKLHEYVSDCEDKNAAAVWDAYEEQVSVGDANYHGRAYASGNRIYVDSASAAKGSSYQTPYQVVFHESGHAIDYLARKEGSGTGFFYSSTYENGKFVSTIKQEVSDWVDSVGATLKTVFKEHGTDYDWLVNNGYISSNEASLYKLVYNGEAIKYSKSRAYSAVEKEIRSISLVDRGNLSDIVEGATKAKVQAGVGHGKSYWSGAGGNENLGTEAFAEMMDATLANSGSLDTIKKYLPESYGVFQDMLKELSGN